MKIWKKMLLSIAGVSTLVCGAFFLPTIVNQYDDKREVNKIYYEEANNIDVLQSNSKQDMAYNFKFLSDIYNSGKKPYIMQIPFEPDKQQKAEIKARVESELEKWLTVIDDLIYYYVDLTQGCDIKEINLYSLYNDLGTERNNKITYLEVSLTTNGTYENSIKVYLDSSSYKIYLVSLTGGYLNNYSGNWKWVSSNIFQYENDNLDYVNKKIEEYYELKGSDMRVMTDKSIDDKFECVINESVVWSGTTEIEEEKDPYQYRSKVFIGIRGFGNGFSDVGQIPNSNDEMKMDS